MGKTQYEIWRGMKPNVSHFHIFGSKCYILNDWELLRKFDSKSDERVFLGYSNNNRAYRVYNVRIQTIMESADVVVPNFNDFLEFSKKKEIASLSDKSVETFGTK